MDREEIIRMAREAGLRVGTNLSGVVLVGSPAEIGLAHLTIEELERFAALVAAAAKAEENEELRQGLVRMAALYEKAANDRDALFEKYVASAIRAKGRV